MCARAIQYHVLDTGGEWMPLIGYRNRPVLGTVLADEDF